jgi:hypothetical protein
MIKDQTEIMDELMAMHKHGLPDGARQGWGKFDDHLRFIAGSSTDILGYPFKGKSLLLREIIVNLAANAKKRTLLHLPDDGEDVQVVANIINAMSGKHFDRKYEGMITERELQTYATSLLTGIDFISSNIRVDPVELWTMGKDYDVIGIDSWNKLGHKKSLKDPDYIGWALSERNRLMRVGRCHCVTVWHPKNPFQDMLTNGEAKPPSVYQFHGGAEVNNNAMNIIVIHKNSRDDYNEPYEVIIQKVKPKQCGQVGQFSIHYDYPMKRFYFRDPATERRTYAEGAIKEEEDNELPF